MTDDDGALASAVLAGDRAALAKLVAREHSWLVRLAQAVVRDRALADEVVQDAWIAIIRALGSFEGRSSLRTWMATIVLNRAKTAAVRGARSVSLSAAGLTGGDDDAGIESGRFGALGAWSRAPEPWHDGTPEALLERREVLEAIGASMQELPETQAAVLTLRDLEGWSSEEVCNALGLSESNQRGLLHRARARVRAALERVLGEPRSS